MILVLDVFGQLAVAQGRLRRAALLFWAAEDLRNRYGFTVPVEDLPHQTAAVTTVYDQLSAETRAAAYAAGSRMSLPEIVAFALNAQEHVPPST